MSARDGETRGLGGFLRSLLAGIPWSECAECEESFSEKRPSGGSLHIHNANGRTRVIGEDRDDVEVDVCKQARAETPEAAEELLDRIRVLSEEVAGTLELEVDVPGRWNRRGHAHLVVRVPRAIEVEVVSSNGRVCMDGMRGHVKARNSNGPVTISDVVGDIEVFTSNGKVRCDSTCGRLKARSSNSKIEIHEHSGSLDASTSNGVIHADVDEIGGAGVVLSTSNGKILLELPEEVDADVDIRVDNGVIRNARELDEQPSDVSGRLRGRLGRGGVPIKLRTSNGTVSMR